MPIEAQYVNINLCVDKLKDKKNAFNVNSKEFIPRNTNSKLNDVEVARAYTPDSDSKSGQTTRSSSPVICSSQENMQKKNDSIQEAISSLSVQDNQSQNSDLPKETSTLILTEDLKSVGDQKKVENKATVINHNKNTNESVVSNSSNVMNSVRVYDKDRNSSFNKDYNRYSTSNKITEHKLNKSMILIAEKSKNTIGISSPNNDSRTKSGPPSNASQPSQAQSPAALLPPNPQMSPYLFQSVPQFPPGPIHFPGQYVPIPAPQQLNSSMPFHFPQYPYATPPYLPSGPPPPAAHTQYHMPPVSSPYQPYMHPVAMAPFFSSQPPFSQQYYQPSHLQPTWSHLQPSFHISGSPQPTAGSVTGGACNVGSSGSGGSGNTNSTGVSGGCSGIGNVGKTDINSSNVSKYK